MGGKGWCPAALPYRRPFRRFPRPEQDVKLLIPVAGSPPSSAVTTPSPPPAPQPPSPPPPSLPNPNPNPPHLHHRLRRLRLCRRHHPPRWPLPPSIAAAAIAASIFTAAVSTSTSISTTALVAAALHSRTTAEPQPRYKINGLQCCSAFCGSTTLSPR